MNRNRPSPPRPRWRGMALSGVVLYTACLLLLAGLAYAVVQTHRQLHRGITYGPPPDISLAVGRSLGVNTALEQYDDQGLAQAVTLISQGGFRWVRQRFPWDQIEPVSDEYQWQPWDRIVAAVEDQGLSLIAVLERSPAWARASAGDSHAPPDDVADYVTFAATVAARYQGRIAAYQIWDQPNIWPYWGEQDIDPAAYAALLKAGYQAIKQADPRAVVLSAGLAPNVEPGGRNMSDVLFLDGMYRAGAKPYFDVLGAKPYGFWSGPEDRWVSPATLNFSRLILLRETMVQHGDGDKAVWAVEMGWNALPEEWTGPPSPWGTDTEAKQADRLAGAIRRAREEWPWLGPIVLQHFHPAAPPDDPIWGFALVAADGQPRLAYEVLQTPDLTDPGPFVARRRPFERTYVSLSLIAAALLIVTWRLVRVLKSPSWLALVRDLARRFRELAEWQQMSLLAAAVILFYLAPNLGLSLLLLLPVAALIVLRLDLGLAAVIFAAPFFFHPKSFGPRVLSLVEIITLLCFAAWCLFICSRWPLRAECAPPGAHSARSGQALVQRVLHHAIKIVRKRRWRTKVRHEQENRTRHRLIAVVRRLSSLDWAVLLLVAVGILSIGVSEVRAVSLRELRVVVLEPALFYLMLRALPLERKGLLRLTDALVAAGTVVALYGLYTYFFTDLVITAEGVRRMRSVYPSPNNLALYLGRVIPLAGAVALFAEPGRRRWAYGLACVPMLVALFLTLSRGAWLLGLPAAVLFVGLLRGRRTLLTAVGATVVGLLALLPFAHFERIASLFDLRSGTTFRRLKLWEAALHMIRDHPLFGVGLDNFLYQYQSRYLLPEAWQEPNLSHPHNLILDFWTRLGVPGVLTLLWIQALFFRQGLRLYRHVADPELRALTLGLMASMVYVLAHGLVDQSYFVVDLAYVFMLLVAFIQGVSTAARFAVLEMPRPPERVLRKRS